MGDLTPIVGGAVEASDRSHFVAYLPHDFTRLDLPFLSNGGPVGPDGEWSIRASVLQFD